METLLAFFLFRFGLDLLRCHVCGSSPDWCLSGLSECYNVCFPTLFFIKIKLND